MRSVAGLLTVLALVAATLVAQGEGAAVAAGNPRTPGNYGGLGFDQCQAPSQHAMDRWRKHSPFRAVGIYISGNSRFCRDQRHLDATWVSRQLARGWHLLPITLGPQASCQPRFPRYGPKIDPTIRTDPRGTYARARAQARAEADKAIGVARSLGLPAGSTMFYDLEGFDLHHSTRCTQSAKWFLSSWSNQLHRHGYLSGIYSSAGSGIRLLDQTRQHLPSGYVLPDMLWIARWDGRANTSAPHYLSDAGWADHQRVKQYRGGHYETHGGVRINIDSNYLDLRNRRVPRAVHEAGDTMADPRCTRDSISHRWYRWTTATRRAWAIGTLQCLLKQQRLYVGSVTGTWDNRTTQGLATFQRTMHQGMKPGVNRAVWMALLTSGASDQALRYRDRGPDVVRLQRALNAATEARLGVTGYYNKDTRQAVTTYKKMVGLRADGVASRRTWADLHAGRRS